MVFYPNYLMSTDVISPAPNTWSITLQVSTHPPRKVRSLQPHNSLQEAARKKDKMRLQVLSSDLLRRLITCTDAFILKVQLLTPTPRPAGAMFIHAFILLFPFLKC